MRETIFNTNYPMKPKIYSRSFDNALKGSRMLVCFFTYKKELRLFLGLLENFVLPMGPDRAQESLKVTSVVYKRHLRAVTTGIPPKAMSRLGSNMCQ